MNLEFLQRAMTQFIFHREGNDGLRSALPQYDNAELSSRLSIYQNNTFYSLIEALKDLYPSVVTTIGEDLFSASAREYLKEFPPKSAAMIDFGHDFPKFLMKFEAVSHLGYLPSLAALELLRHLSYHASDDIPVQPESFAALDIQILAASKIKAIDSAYLLTSPFAVFDIWQLATGEIENTIDADQAQNVLVIRPYGDVDVYKLDQGIYLFLDALNKGSKIDQALELASELTNDFNPTNAISFLIQSGFTAQIIGEHT